MKIVAVRGDHSVTLEIEGATTALLRQAETTALRLLGDPAPKPAKPKIGFAATEETPDA